MTEDQGRWGYILEQGNRQLGHIIERNNRLDDRADRLIQTGGVFIGLFTVANLPIEWSFVWPEVMQAMMLLAGFGTFLGAILFYLWRFRPVVWRIPGTSDWEKIFTDYLNSDNFQDQLLSDLTEGIKSAEEINAYKAKGVRVLTWLLFFQTAAVAAAWLASGF